MIVYVKTILLSTLFCKFYSHFFDTVDLFSIAVIIYYLIYKKYKNIFSTGIETTLMVDFLKNKMKRI